MTISFRNAPDQPVVSQSLRRRRNVLFVVDESYSVNGKAEGDTLSKAERFYEGLMIAKRVFAQQEAFSRSGEVACILFNSVIKKHPFTSAIEWSPPTLSPGGNTHIGEALLAGNDHLRQRLAELNQQGVDIYHPYTVLISDGKPYGESQSAVLASYAQARNFEAQGYTEFLLLGVEEADREHLLAMGLKNPPMIVQDTNWETVFTWVSQRVSAPVVGQMAVSNPSQARTL